jgi:hypothetical protein
MQPGAMSAFPNLFATLPPQLCSPGSARICLPPFQNLFATLPPRICSPAHPEPLCDPRPSRIDSHEIITPKGKYHLRFGDLMTIVTFVYHVSKSYMKTAKSQTASNTWTTFQAIGLGFDTGSTTYDVVLSFTWKIWGNIDDLLVSLHF